MQHQGFYFNSQGRLVPETCLPLDGTNYITSGRVQMEQISLQLIIIANKIQNKSPVLFDRDLNPIVSNRKARYLPLSTAYFASSLIYSKDWRIALSPYQNSLQVTLANAIQRNLRFSKHQALSHCSINCIFMEISPCIALCKVCFLLAYMTHVFELVTFLVRTLRSYVWLTPVTEGLGRLLTPGPIS